MIAKLSARVLGVAVSCSFGCIDASVDLTPGGETLDPGATDIKMRPPEPTTVAGRTAGQLTVSRLGTATYALPLWTPPGVGEIRPTLALVYNSAGGASPFGVGWSLSGLSQISRCPTKWATHGYTAGVTRTKNDRLCLDGYELMLVYGYENTAVGVYGAPGASYRTQNESFTDVMASMERAGGGPLYFTAKSKSGLTYTYGTNFGTAPAAAVGPATWFLSGVQDRSGNRMLLHYVQDQVRTRLERIEYPITATGQGPFYAVTLYYADRPDAQGRFVAGVELVQSERVTSIVISDATTGALIKRYELSYAQGIATGRSQLRSVRECAGSANECFAPTTIAYQDGVPRYAAAAENALTSAEPGAVLHRSQTPLDLNGDGRTDFLYSIPCDGSYCPTGLVYWKVRYGSAQGYLPDVLVELPSGVAATPMPPVVGRFAPVGRDQVLLRVSAAYPNVHEHNTYYVLAWSPGGLRVSPTGIVGFNTGGTAKNDLGNLAADLDGDGRPELVRISQREVWAHRNESVGHESVSFGAAQKLLDVDQLYLPGTSWHSLSAFQPAYGRDSDAKVGDFNGDGRADLMVGYSYIQGSIYGQRIVLLSERGGGPGSGGEFALSIAARFASTHRDLTRGASLLDWNGDGCTDILVHGLEYPVATLTTKLLLSDCTGRSWPEISLVDMAHTTRPLVIDYDGNGSDDVLYEPVATNTGTFTRVLRADAALGFSDTALAEPLGPGHYNAFAFDENNDGRHDIGFTSKASHSQTSIPLVYRANGMMPDVATSFTDGYDNRQTVEYRPLTAPSVYSGSGPVQYYPSVNVVSSRPVVTKVTSPDGLVVGNVNTETFTYGDLQMDLQGCGVLGFGEMRRHSSASGITEVSRYRLDFPYTGTIIDRVRLAGESVLQRRLVTPGVRAATDNGETRYFVYAAMESTQDYELPPSPGAQGKLVRMTEESKDFDANGNVPQRTVLVHDMDDASPTAGEVWTTRELTTYHERCLDLPVRREVINQGPVGEYTDAQSDSTLYTIDGGACRVHRTTREPGGSNHETTTTFDYDGCGNVRRTTVVGTHDGAPMTPRVTTADFGPRCQAPLSTTNALGETTTVEYEPHFGVPVMKTDGNGLVTRTRLDAYGRVIAVEHPDGTRTTTERARSMFGPGFVETTTTELDRHGSVVARSVRITDLFDRPWLTKSLRPLGADAFTQDEEIVYDALGRMVRRFAPWRGEYRHGFEEWAYDLYGRVLRHGTYTELGELDRETRFSYDGNRSVATDRLGTATTTWTDARGLVRRVDEAGIARTDYLYNARRLLVQRTGTDGAVLARGYDSVGNLVSEQRPNTTTQTFWMYNSLGEVTQELQGGQWFTYTYDLLGRRLSKSNGETVKIWTFGADPAARNVGRLVRVSGETPLLAPIAAHGTNYSEEYTFDALGRPATVTTTIGASVYVAHMHYGADGAVARLTYPEFGFELSYTYDNGALVKISGPDGELWRAEAFAFDGAVERERALGVLVRVKRAPQSQAVVRIEAGTNGTNDLQDLSYRWDARGNLVERADRRQGIRETFTYDALSRLISSQRNDLPNLWLSYFPNGNIAWRSDVGTYEYLDPALPHAVTRAGAHTYAYDANGRLTNRDGAFQLWSIDGMPLVMSDGQGYAVMFAYTPDDRQYLQRTWDGEVTHYVGAMEKILGADGAARWRFSVRTPGATTVVATRQSPAADFDYSLLLTDHLGSTDVVVDAAGGVMARQSFDAFGKRRGVDWQGEPGAEERFTSARQTRRGFTGHEQLDGLGLVNMGARLYDPTIGRFLSVDAALGKSSQSMNGYSYVSNRPLSATDPTGNEESAFFDASWSSSYAWSSWGWLTPSITGFSFESAPTASASGFSADPFSLNTLSSGFGGSGTTSSQSSGFGAAMSYASGWLSGWWTRFKSGGQGSVLDIPKSVSSQPGFWDGYERSWLTSWLANPYASPDYAADTTVNAGTLPVAGVGRALMRLPGVEKLTPILGNQEAAVMRWARADEFALVRVMESPAQLPLLRVVIHGHPTEMPAREVLSQIYPAVLKELRATSYGMVDARICYSACNGMAQSLANLSGLPTRGYSGLTYLWLMPREIQAAPIFLPR